LLLCEYEALQRDLRQHRDIIEQLRKENEAYRKVLERISIINTHKAMYQVWADNVLREQQVNLHKNEEIKPLKS
jgi:predicted patatin/cPLA2 family phospholipase